MKKFIIGIFIGLCTAASAQEKKEIEINDLFIPDAPGLILGDKAPTSVSKPTTPRAFGASIVNLANGGAVEVTPFWLTRHPKYTYMDYVDKKITLKETFNISLASYKDEKLYSLAPGFRAQVFRIFEPRTKKKINQSVEDLENILGTMPLDLKTIEKKASEIDSVSRRGFFALEVAAAMVASSSRGSLDHLEFEKSGVWANLRWNPSKFPLSLIALTRFSWKAKGMGLSDSSYLDLGTSVNYVNKRLDLSAEFVHRRAEGKKQFERLAVIVNYAITENIIVVGSLGKDITGVSNLISLVGIKFGLSRSKVAF